MIEELNAPPLCSTSDAYLILNLGEAVFGIEVSKIIEMRNWLAVTRLPKTPDYVCGLRNVRGNIVPIMDLRQRLALAKKAHDKTTVVILLQVNDKARQTTKVMGLAVDAVSDALPIASNSIKAAPDFGQQLNTSYIKGLSEINGNLVTLLDTDMLFSIDALV